MTPSSSRIKRWPSWALLLFVVAGLMAVGSTRDGGARTPEERLESISKRLGCPVCDGESVYESQNAASTQIRAEIRARVTTSDATDDEVIAYIVQNFGGRTQLVPTATGFEALVWVLPSSAFVCAAVGLGLAFHRWRAALDTVPDDDDRALVAAALDRADGAATGPVDDVQGEDER